MAESSKTPARPWTPTEKPGDASYTSPVVYYGDHQVKQENSDVSSDEDSEADQPMSAIGKEVVGEEDQSRPQPLRFRSSQALREEAAASAPETTTYQPYGASRSSDSSKIEITQTLRTQRSSQNLVPENDALPANNPYRLSQTPKMMSAEDFSQFRPPSNPQGSSSDNDSHLPLNNPYRVSQMARSESTEGLIVKSQRPTQAPRSESAQNVPTVRPHRLSESSRGGSSDSVPVAKPKRQSQQPTSKADDDLPSVTGQSTRAIRILLINPNSTRSMTDRCLESISNTLPLNVTVYGFTPSRPAPTAIESQTDAIMSTATCTKAIVSIASKYDAFLVACFSHHPLIAALREQLMQPVIGIMEASLYASRMCGSKFGILATGIRSMYLHESSVKTVYGLGSFSVGAESARLGVLELESLPEEVVEEKLADAAKRLQTRGADCICLGCAGMTDWQKICQDAVGMHDRMAMVIDGVAIGIHFLIGLVRENLGTAKGAAYNTATGHKALQHPA